MQDDLKRQYWDTIGVPRQRMLRFSEPHVMESAAGFYIGRTENIDGDPQPYERLSGYFPSREVAQSALDEKDYEW